MKRGHVVQCVLKGQQSTQLMVMIPVYSLGKIGIDYLNIVNNHFSERHCQKRFITGGQSGFMGIVFITQYALKISHLGLNQV